jgi:hypothetical protein
MPSAPGRCIYAACLVITVLLLVLEELGIKLNERRTLRQVKKKKKEASTERHASIFIGEDEHDRDHTTTL